MLSSLLKVNLNLTTFSPPQDRLSAYTTIASVLHLGNIEFEDDPDDNRGGCRVTDASEKSLQITGELLGLDPGKIRVGMQFSHLVY